MAYKLEAPTRDMIINWLKVQIVPANVGAGMIQVAGMLENLAVLPDEKIDTANEAPAPVEPTEPAKTEETPNA